jgi:F-type H+-transporting ATPase subunit beta
MAATAKKPGKIVQIIGSTFDVEFEEGHLPEIYNALKIDATVKGGLKIKLTGEVQQHLGGSRVRCVALGSTDGLVRGLDVADTGAPLSVPVGSTCSATPSTAGARSGRRKPVASTASRRSSTNCRRNPKCW